jgi:RNA polymerase sigma-70 factor, ECF subfamily
MDTSNATDTAAALKVFFAEEAWLYGLARRLVRDDAAAQDLVQDTWAATLENPPKDKTKPRAWLRTVAGRLATKQREKMRPSIGEAIERHTSDNEQPAEAALRFEVGGRLRRAVESLGEPHRSAVLLRFQEGLPLAEIARRQGVSERSIRNRLGVALEKIQWTLGAELDGSELDGKMWAVTLAPLLQPADLNLVNPGWGVVGNSALKLLKSPAVVGATLVAAALVVGTSFGALNGGETDGPRPAQPATTPESPLAQAQTPIPLAPPLAEDLRQAVDGLAGSPTLVASTPSTTPPPVGPGADTAAQEDPTGALSTARFPMMGRILIDDAAPTGWKASGMLIDPRNRIQPPTQGTVDSEGRFEVIGHFAGLHTITLTAEVGVPLEAVNGRGHFVFSREVGPDCGDQPCEFDIHTGDLEVVTDGEEGLLFLEFHDSEWRYYSTVFHPKEGRVRFRQVPEGTLTLTRSGVALCKVTVRRDVIRLLDLESCLVLEERPR